MNRLVKQPINYASLLMGVTMALVSTYMGTAIAQAQCPPGTACDPGPRPVGSQTATFPGPTNSSGVPLLPTPIVNTRQPADASGNEGAGRAIANSGQAGKFWGDAGGVFGQLASVNGATDPASNNPTLLGLGPAFNGNSCFMCHSQPTIGGSSPGIGTPGFTQNPQITLANAFGASNPENLSTFITPNGPIREARFIVNETDPNRLTLDGGVHDLFSIQGRSDAPPGCVLSQPDITTQLANKNVIFRIPTPTFGLGLVENVANADLINNAALEHGLNSSVQNAVLNVTGNDGTVTRFGWKAQNKSLLLFAGEASNVELGMTNELFQNERTPGTSCTGNPLPEDDTHVVFQTGLNPQDVDSFVSSAIENFAVFMRINGSPGQCDFASGVDGSGNALCNPLSAAAQAGLTVFNNIGCNVCHTQSFTTQPSNVAGLSNRTFEPFSDFGLHHMGLTLADGVTQGVAGPDQFRTAPLWGLGQRLFFLHDGRTSDLKQAIQDHFSNPLVCYITATSQIFTVMFPLDNNATSGFVPLTGTSSCGSEANQVVTNFNNQSVANQQNLLDFLRSL
jgi:Di-haem oxidoreductase, putative peroxidase